MVDVEQKNGLANIIYVKNFVSEDKSESVDRSKNCTGKKTVQAKPDQYKKNTSLKNRPVQNKDESDNHTGTGIENRPQVVQNLDPNNTDINNISIIRV